MERIKIEIKNWHKHQAKYDPKRNWSWIKVKRELLTDFHFRELSAANKWNLVGLWCLADAETGIVDMETRELYFMLGCKSLVVEDLDYFCKIPEQSVAIREQSVADSEQSVAVHANNCALDKSRVDKSREEENRVDPVTKPKQSVADRRDGFCKFWELYPSGKKHNKTKCRDKFMQLTREITPDEIVNGLIPWIGSPDWTKDSGQYIPHASTFLNDARWESPPESKNISQSTGRPEGSPL